MYSIVIIRYNFLLNYVRIIYRFDIIELLIKLENMVFIYICVCYYNYFCYWIRMELVECLKYNAIKIHSVIIKSDRLGFNYCTIVGL